MGISFDYFDDDEEVDEILNVPDEEDEPKEHKQPEYIPLIEKLTEDFVDDGYKLPRVHPKELDCLQYIKKQFRTRLREPIPFYDLMAVMYDCDMAMGRGAVTSHLHKDKEVKDNKTMGKFHITNTLRRLWRAGYIRRFYKKRVKWGNQANRQKLKPVGIHYMLEVD